MEHWCNYRMIVRGEKSDIKEFRDAMLWEGKYLECGAGRIFSCHFMSNGIEPRGDKFAIELEGNCAWSIESSMMKSENPNNIVNLSKQLNLSIEAYSSEIGFEFQEHIYIENGNIVLNDVVNWVEVYEEHIPYLGDDFWESDFVKEAGVTKDNYHDFIKDDYLVIGGYQWDWRYI